MNESRQRLDSLTRRAAAWEWACRHDFELEARSRFGRLTETLKQHHAPNGIIELTDKAAKDEHRHAGLCRELVHRFGGPLTEDRHVNAPPVFPEKLPPRSRLLYELVAMSCVTETLSCTLLSIMIERTQDAHLKRTMQSILSDEVGHSRLGWAYLSDQSRLGPQSFISDYLPAMLANTVHEEIFQPDKSSPFDAVLGEMGILSRAERLEVFVETMKSVVFPGLERFDVDPSHGMSWLEQQMGTISS